MPSLLSILFLRIRVSKNLFLVNSSCSENKRCVYKSIGFSSGSQRPPQLRVLGPVY